MSGLTENKSFLDRILRAGEGKRVRAVQALLPEINALEPSLQMLSDAALQAKTAEFKSRLDRGENVDSLLIEAFAVVREASSRVLGQRHFDVQMMGGATLHFGWVAEMKTGEGKTLVATLPSYLNALSGRGVHVVTVNEYLAGYHAEWMGRLHRFLGLEVGLVTPSSTTRKRLAYAADITYGTNNEFGFDYLRDNMARSADAKVQRGHHFAIVDEVDSILIDEARTPLIISGAAADAAGSYHRFAALSRTLVCGRDYEVEEDKKVVIPTEEGIARVEEALGVANLFDGRQVNLVHQLSVALKAKELYQRDRDYIVDGHEVKIVDEFTGRILPGRRWNDGLHQAIEAKEGVKVKEENRTLATVTLQNYFRMYDKLSGMTGTAQTEAAEIHNTYKLHVVPIETNRPSRRADLPDVIFKSEREKFDALVTDIAARHATGQPVLVGTVSVAKSETVSMMLTQRGVPHEVLNAKQHAREAEIVAQAGRLGAVTVATNMAGRGVDILLGGNSEGLARKELASEGFDCALLEAHPEDAELADAAAKTRTRFAELCEMFAASCRLEADKVRALGGLYVLGTERHESRRIDNQLRGRSGRQGDPGASRFYLSLDDELLRLFATGAMQWVMSRTLPDGEPLEAKMVTKAIERAQTTVEQRNAEARKNVLKYDEVLDAQRKVIYRRRDQILSGMDLRNLTQEHLAAVIDATIDRFCPSAASDEWDLEGLVTHLSAFWPSIPLTQVLARIEDANELHATLFASASDFYTAKEQLVSSDVMRDVERQVMLHLIDQHWQEHLAEMDHLKDGINLRAMGQKDPLSEWQREGFELFAAMMDSVAQEFVKYVMNVELVSFEQAETLATQAG